jgi:hypothetical protein
VQENEKNLKMRLHLTQIALAPLLAGALLCATGSADALISITATDSHFTDGHVFLAGDGAVSVNITGFDESGLLWYADWAIVSEDSPDYSFWSGSFPRSTPGAVTIYAMSEDDPGWTHATFYISSVQVETIAFSGAGNVPLQVDDGSFANNGTDNLEAPQYDSSLYVQKPICYNWGTGPTLDATFSVTPSVFPGSDVLIQVVGIQHNQPAVELGYPEVSVDLGTVAAYGTGPITTLDGLPYVIDNTSYDLIWYISDDSGNTYKQFATTSNPLYEIADGTPHAPATVTRMDWATQVASSATSPTTAAELFRDALSADPGAGPLSCAVMVDDYGGNMWAFLDLDTGGDCLLLASMATIGLDMVGILAGADQAFPTWDGSTFRSSVPRLLSPNTCKYPVYADFSFSDTAVFEAYLEYPVHQQFEGFFYVHDPGSHVKAYTVFPKNGPFESQNFTRLEVLSFAAKGTQYWIWPATLTRGGVTVYEDTQVSGVREGDAGNIPVPDIP